MAWAGRGARVSEWGPPDKAPARAQSTHWKRHTLVRNGEDAQRRASTGGTNTNVKAQSAPRLNPQAHTELSSGHHTALKIEGAILQFHKPGILSPVIPF